MASPVGVSAFVANDSLKFVLPAFLCFGLLVPFLDPGIDAELLLLVSIFTGMIVTPLIGNAYLWLVKKFTDLATKSSLEQTRGVKRWHYDRMVYAVSRDERNTITLSDARSTLTLLMSAGFGAFVVASLIYVPFHIAPPDGDLDWSYIAKLLTVPIPVLGGQKVSAWIAVLFGGVICERAIRQHFRQQYLLFGVEYQELARKTHLDSGGIARAIWGSVANHGSGSLELHTVTGQLLAKTEVEDDGQFTFDVEPSSITSDYLCITFKNEGLEHVQNFRFSPASVPEFLVTPPAAPVDKAQVDDKAGDDANSGKQP